MLHRVELAFADTRADHLRWSVEHPVVDALASREVRVSDVRLDLRVLGASHQVAVLGPDDVPRLVETVAYLPGVRCPLPDRVAPAGHPTYELRSVTRHLTPGRLTDRVRGLVARLEADPLALLARFPGDPSAVTALLAEQRPDGVGWRTWHAYPQHGELVETRTRLTGLTAPWPGGPPPEPRPHTRAQPQRQPQHRTGVPR